MNDILLKNVDLKKISNYELDMNTILLIYNGKLELPNKQELAKLVKIEYEDYVKTVKHKISKIEDYIPLFDIFSKRMFMINKHNVYNRVINEHYRIIDQTLLNKLIETGESKYDPLVKFMNTYYDLKKLEKTYMIVFYKYSNNAGKNLTTCKRPSFLSIFTYIKPYYSRSEVINMGLNMGLIKSDNKTYYDNKLLNELCSKVIENDINAKILLDHRSYIINSNYVNLIQYYSLNGSYFVNKYLRNLNNTEYYNEILHENTLKLWKIVKNSPSFDKDYILYRFVTDDDYISTMNIGDIFIDKGFMSTTRDPFYKSEIYKFGFILIKIKIPKNARGVGLSIESFSNFSSEQEIILAPFSNFKLLNKDMDCEYYTTDDQFNSQIIRKYEFEYVIKEIDEIKIMENIKNKYKKVKNEGLLNLNEVKILDELSLSNKIMEFQNKYINEIFQFKIQINKITFTIQTEWYDSTIAYKGFYAVDNKEGFSMYCFYQSKLLFFLEIMEPLHELHVNYYFRHSENINLYDYISETDYIHLLCKISYIFGIQKIVLYGNYYYCYKWNKNSTSTLGSFRIDFVDYLKNGNKRFDGIDEIKSRFDYFQLDKLKHILPNEILSINDSDEIYQIWQTSKTTNVADLYLYIIDHYCNLVNVFEKKINRLFKGMQISFNPFLFDYYILESHVWLYNHKYISHLPDLDKHIVDIPLIVEKNKNRYRT